MSYTPSKATRRIAADYERRYPEHAAAVRFFNRNRWHARTVRAWEDCA